ncbi:MAG: hypothetical protein JNN27_13910 [Planctomycetes bacterium]|nr:hypothetical protein [Planctomycetota bacterium]
MTTEQFVSILRSVVRDATVANVPKTLAHPPGRAPAADLVALSKWYRGLPPEDQLMLRRVVEYSVDATMFHVLCVLDGAAAIEDPGERGELVLEHVGPRGRTRLNDPAADSLHELW